MQCINEYVGWKRRMGKLGREEIKHDSFIILSQNESWKSKWKLILSTEITEFDKVIQSKGQESRLLIVYSGKRSFGPSPMSYMWPWTSNLTSMSFLSLFKISSVISAWGFLGGLHGKESACNAGDPDSIPARVGKIPWKREWQPTSVFLPGEFHGQRSLASYSLWSRKKSAVIEWLTQTHTICLADRLWEFDVILSVS